MNAVGVWSTAILVAALALPGPARADEALSLTRMTFHDLQALEGSAKGKPNETARLAGLKAWVRGDATAAAEQFRIAASYADKFSQHALALMYWQGTGVPKDRVQAYVWSDLAAERGTKRLLLVREKLWSELTPAERDEAVAQGEDFYARYGDAVAQPRTEGAIRLFQSKMTGSHLGFQRGKLEIGGRPEGGAFGLQTGSNAAAYANATAPSAADLYGEGRSAFAGYWRQQDLQLSGAVETGGLQEVRTTPRK
ncbi:hypothetical protein [Lysobacter xanthus]